MQPFLPHRQLVLVDLLALLLGVRPGERALVAIDGVDGVGKTHLVQELLSLAPHVAGRDLLGISIDGFHRPRAERHREGSGPESFYRDSYDYDAFRSAVVTPFRAGHDITPAVFDVAADRPISSPPLPAGDDAVLLVDGIFLRRPELAGVWDASVLVMAPFAVAVPRGNARFDDVRARPGWDDPDHPSNHRYVEGQRRYLAEARDHPPTWILDNTDLDRPLLIDPDPDAPQWLG